MRRLPCPVARIVATCLLVVAFGAGCQFIKTAKDTPPVDELDETVPLPEEDDSRKELPAPEAIAAVHGRLHKGDQYLRQQQYDKAHHQYRIALRILLDRVQEDGREQHREQLDQAFLQVNVALVRVARLRGITLPHIKSAGDLDIQYNERVEKWTNYYLANGRGSMVKYLERSGTYFEMIESVLAERGLPEDLKYLPIIESGFSPYAYSPAAACGLWQFIPSTGRRYGMRVDEWVDERRDPIRATYAAADYLAFLYDMFDDWALSLAAYNCGEACVARAIQNAGGDRNYWNLSLPAETMDYVPKFMAAATIARDPEVNGFYVEPSEPMRVKKVALSGVARLSDLAQKTGHDYDELKRLNPALLGSTTPPNDPNFQINIPLETADEFEKALVALGPSAYLAPDEISKVSEPPKSQGGKGGKQKVVYYKVKKGDTLGGIAKKYKTSVAAIKRLNKIKGNTLKTGMKLKIVPGAKK
ncbi:MAG: transglycosylase SLT domain-containing protein [Deltaproteobacteria bacterium]|nr:transglycosylase SLT domain-containing protein [Deltaproteobacteria bacterium]